MNATIKKAIIIALSLCLLLSITGCSKDKNPEKAAGIPSDNPDGFADSIVGSNGSQTYNIKEVKISGKPYSILADRYGDFLYLLCTSRDNEFIETGRWLISYDLDTGKTSELWRGEISESSICGMATDKQGNTWFTELVCENIEPETPDTYEDEGDINTDEISMTYDADETQRFFTVLNKIDKNGKLQRWDVEFLNDMAINKLVYLDGRLYMACYGLIGSMMYGLDISSGEPDLDADIPAISLDGHSGDFAVSSDGFLYFLDSEGKNLSTLDHNSGEFITTLELRVPTSVLFTGDESYSLYFSDGNNLYGISKETNEKEKILNWINAGMVDTAKVIPMGSGSLFCTRVDRKTLNDICEILTPAEPSKGKVSSITLATAYGDYALSEAVSDFNRTSRDVKVDYLDYSVYNTDADLRAGATKLDDEISSGNCPDIVSLTGLPSAKYASGGILEDLYSFIDNDNLYGRKSFLENILTAFEIKGGLYELPLSFHIKTVVGAKEVLGDVEGWSVDKYEEITKKADAKTPFGQTSGFNYMDTVISLINPIDWDTGTASFATPKFIEQLELSKKLHNSYSDTLDLEEPWNMYDAVKSSQQYLWPGSISSTFSIRYCRAMFGEDGYSFIGYPGAVNSGSAVSANSCLGISSSSKYKEESWQFLRYLLDADRLVSLYGIPITNDALVGLIALTIEEEKKLSTEGETHQVWMGKAVDVTYSPESDAEVLKELVSKQTIAARRDDELSEIVNTELALYFESEKTLEDTIKDIQDRAQEYAERLIP